MSTAHGQRAGLVLALASAATFGTSGSFATSLLDAGWSPAAAVTARVSIAAVVLTVPALIALRGRFDVLLRGWRTLGVYGVGAVAGAQVGFFNAVQHLSVGVALLLEYLGILLVVGWMWLRHNQRPGRLTLAGAVAAVIGLALVLDVTGRQHVDLVGVLWGLGAAVGLAVYYVLSARAHEQLPPITMAWATLGIGGVSLALAGVVGLAPMHASTADVRFLHHQMSWLVPVLGLSLVAAVFSYATGIYAARALGATVSSFVGLSEVLFAVLWAWLLLGQLPGTTQLVGGVFIVAGVALVRLEGTRTDPARRAAARAGRVRRGDRDQRPRVLAGAAADPDGA